VKAPDADGAPEQEPAAPLDPFDPALGGWWPPGSDPEPLRASWGAHACRVAELVTRIRADAGEVEVDDTPARGLARLAAMVDTVGRADRLTDRKDALSGFLSIPLDDVCEAAADRVTRPEVEQILAALEAVDKLTRRGQRLGKLVRDGADRLVRERAAVVRESQRVQVVDGLPGCLEGYRLPKNWGVSKAGLLRLVKVEADEILWDIVAPRPMFIVGKASDPSTGEHYVDVWWEPSTKGPPVRRTVPRLDIADARRLVALAGQGAPVDSDNATDFVRFLRALEAVNAGILPMRSVVSSMGWARLDGDKGRAFVLGSDVLGTAESVELRPPPGTEAHLAGWACRGNRGAWDAGVTPVLRRYPVVGAIYLAALASPLLRVIGCRSFVVDLACDTGHGKSTALSVACSIWGNPEPGGGVFQTWDGTEVAIERLAALCGNLPLCLDETKLAGGARARDVGQILYRITSGVGRSRGKPDGIREVHRWGFVCLSTGEVPVVNASHDAGTRARVLSLTALPFGPQSAEGRRVTESVETTCRAHYGHAGRVLVEYLTGPADLGALRARFDELRASFGARFEPGTATRLSVYGAALLLAAEVALELGVPCPDRTAVVGVLDEAIKRGAAEADRPRAALVEVLSWLNANPARVVGLADIDDEQSGRPSQGWIGKVEEGERVCIVSGELIAHLERRGYSSSGEPSTWARRGWLSVSGGRGSTKTVRFPGGGRPHCYVVPWYVSEALLEGRDPGDVEPDQEEAGGFDDGWVDAGSAA
jgi:uncharacterized protein (DUF927 family)